ncbi:MAG: PTS sugar transporter subunit IIA [Spirochaetes bacterium]|jgi:PTS system nitrogen regulatory IIA component|nr:PTS sugar transporter subunit IIA [Spirochaetota bacterium]
MHIDSFFSEHLTSFDKSFDNQDQLFRFLSKIFSFEMKCDEEKIYTGLTQREAISSTYLGHGIALPHCRVEDVSLLKIAFIKLQKPLTIKNDEQDVDINYVFSVITNITHEEFYVAVLARLTRFLASHKSILPEINTYEQLSEKLHSFSESLSGHLNAYEISTIIPAVDENQTVKDAVDVMKKNRLATLPVIDSKNMVKGIIRITDLFRASLPDYVFYLQDFSFITEFSPLENFWENESQMIIKNYMKSSTEFFIQDNVSYLEVLFLISKHKREQLIVIDKDGLYKGVITPATILNTMLRP